ncbi:MAG: ribulose-5-phosphate 4-epimerase and related epimerases and aldolase [Nitrospirae bacterium]|nr:MAG: ribulose-5-phosphate 4-epimerase and related epimerases and aldolase [Nitrospirota bacterium]
MEKTVQKYLGKIEAQGLAHRDDVVLFARDADVYCNRTLREDERELHAVLETMNVSSLLFARPAEPYWTILEQIALRDETVPAEGRIVPRDAETRTFLHDIPVLEHFWAADIAAALSRRKTAIIRGRGIVTFGSMTPEQSYIMLSSTCFTAFVKYFSDALHRFREAVVDEEDLAAFRRIWRASKPFFPGGEILQFHTGTANDDDMVLAMIAEVGRAVVDHHLVDSFFGNISYATDDCIYISQTGSSLDELHGCIDKVPFDGTSSAGITASSELSAHKNIYRATGLNAILHGHPKFAVIMSMDCERKNCDRELCYKACPEQRSVHGIPIVSGEIGTGATALMHTAPEALRKDRGVIVYGHGVFTAGRNDFRQAFAELQRVERTCVAAYREEVEKASGGRI